MSLCEQIASKLVAEGALSDQERAHQKSCPECRQLTQTVQRLKSTVLQLREDDAPPAAEIAQIQHALNERIHEQSKKGLRVLRLGFATLALLCIGIVGVWFWVGRGPNEQDAERSAEQLLTILDEVDSMYTPTSSVADYYSEKALQLISESDVEAADLVEGDLGPLLPNAYRSLYAWLDDRSL